MKELWAWTVFLMLGLGYVVVMTIQHVQAQPRPVWVMKDCFDLPCVTRTLNELPPDRAVDAKVIAINSQRSFLGALSSPYYIWYRK